jgi:2-hydroxycyclohexanecarboxyl-CoA dehydrogenase
MDLGLTGKVAIVTGGSGAIGRAIALALAREGARVAITWRSGEAKAEGIVAQVRAAGGEAIAVELDQSHSTSISTAVAAINTRLGRIDIVVANAVEWGSFDTEEIAGLSRSLATNVVGTLELIDATLAGMAESGWGRIILVSTDIVVQPYPGPLAYATAKGGLETAARVLAVREARRGILTNIVRPGFTLTEAALNSRQNAIDAEAAQTPTGQICTPEDVAAAITFLASAVNTQINGQSLSVAGGRELTR